MSYILDGGTATVEQLRAADYVIRLRSVRPGDNHWVVVSNDGLEAIFDTYEAAVQWCEEQETL